MYHPPIGRHLVTQYQRLTKKKNIKLPTSGPKQNKSIREGTVSSLKTWTYHGGTYYPFAVEYLYDVAWNKTL